MTQTIKPKPKKCISGTTYLGILIFIIVSCKTIKVDKIRYDEAKQIYEYPVSAKSAVLLRNNHRELVSKRNFDVFLVELEQMRYRYPFEERLEREHSLKESDFEIASLYSEAAINVKDEAYREAAGKIDTLRKIYPDALKFSDCSFIEGYAYEKTGNLHKAVLKFSEFLTFSSRKYSGRFRGYKYADDNDSLWLQQRNYASEYLSGKKPTLGNDVFVPITPKYYYNNLQPGYSLNDEGLKENSKGIIFFSINTNFSTSAALGVQYYRNINELFDINPGYFTSGDMKAISLAVPMQVYKSENNRLGLKFSPFARYANFTNLHFDGTNWNMDENIFYFGFKASAGYYLMQKLSLGAYYTYNYYNENHPYSIKSQPLTIWWNNEYDVSLYYNILKGFSLKTGVKAGNLVAGIYWNGWEISYNLSNPNLVLRADLY